MIDLTIAPEFKAKIPTVAVGWITATVRNSQHDEALWREIDKTVNVFRGMTIENARKSPPIKALRNAYRTLGNDPTRYQGSTRPWYGGISQGKDLYRVNTVVDINNRISLEKLHSAGTFDLDRVQRPIIFRVGQPGKSTRASAGAKSRSRGCRCLPISLGLSAARPAIPSERWFG